MRIFIGSENKLFLLSRLVDDRRPFRDSEKRVVGVLGVIGPTRLAMRASCRWSITPRVIARIVGGG